MKKVTLLVPDEVISVGGTSHSSYNDKVPTTAASIIEALTANDYHMNYYFPKDSVRVLSLERVEHDDDADIVGFDHKDEGDLSSEVVKEVDTHFPEKIKNAGTDISASSIADLHKRNSSPVIPEIS